MHVASPPRTSVDAAAAPAATVIGEMLFEQDHGGGPVVERMPVLAGRTLVAGTTDIERTALALIRDQVQLPRPVPAFDGLVAFVRRGDAWDAVELLSRDARGATANITDPFSVRGLQFRPGTGVDAIWMVTGFGFDTRWGTPDSMIPAMPAAARA